MNKSISTIVNNLPRIESAVQLQDRLSDIGIQANLTKLPALQVSDKFIHLLGDFLAKPIGEISTEQIQVAIALIKETNRLLETTPHANGFGTKLNEHTFTYRLTGPTIIQTEEAYIREKLGSDAQVIIDELIKIGDDVFKNEAPKLNEATLDTHSYKKTWEEQDMLYAGSLNDLIQATNIAIEAFCKAKELRLDLRTINNESVSTKMKRINRESLKKGLDEGTAILLEKLINCKKAEKFINYEKHANGVIRVSNGSCNVKLTINDDGRFCANSYYGNGLTKYHFLGPS